MWDIYVWLWLNVPVVAFLVTGLTVIFLIAMWLSIFEPRFDMKDFRITQPADPPRPPPRKAKPENKPVVWKGPSIPSPSGPNVQRNNPQPNHKWARMDDVPGHYPSHSRWDSLDGQVKPPDKGEDSPIWYG